MTQVSNRALGQSSSVAQEEVNENRDDGDINEDDEDAAAVETQQIQRKQMWDRIYRQDEDEQYGVSDASRNETDADESKQFFVGSAGSRSSLEFPYNRRHSKNSVKLETQHQEWAEAEAADDEKHGERLIEPKKEEPQTSKKEIPIKDPAKKVSKRRGIKARIVAPPQDAPVITFKEHAITTTGKPQLERFSKLNGSRHNSLRKPKSKSPAKTIRVVEARVVDIKIPPKVRTEETTPAEVKSPTKTKGDEAKKMDVEDKAPAALALVPLLSTRTTTTRTSLLNHTKNHILKNKLRVKSKAPSVSQPQGGKGARARTSNKSLLSKASAKDDCSQTSVKHGQSIDLQTEKNQVHEMISPPSESCIAISLPRPRFVEDSDSAEELTETGNGSGSGSPKVCKDSYCDATSKSRVFKAEESPFTSPRDGAKTKVLKSFTVKASKVPSYPILAIDQIPSSEATQKRSGKPPPDINALLKGCESYMNWSKKSPEESLTTDDLEDYISDLMSNVPECSEESSVETIRKTELIRYKSFECISNLGALSYFQIESKQFQKAERTIGKTKECVREFYKQGYVKKDRLQSLDYVWDYLLLFASKLESDLPVPLEYRHFPDMDITHFTSFDSLDPKGRAGVYGLKASFYGVVEASFEDQVGALKEAISLDPQCPEWHCCLQKVLRQRRKAGVRGNNNNSKQSSASIKTKDSIDEELRTSWTAMTVAPSHPACALSALQLLVDCANINANSNQQWRVIIFGGNRFHHMKGLINYLLEEAGKLIQRYPKSIEINIILADIFMGELPKGHRDIQFGKECLERCLKYTPDCAKAKFRMAQYYLNVERDFKRAEAHFDTTFSLDVHNFKALTSLLYILMRTLPSTKKSILKILQLQLQSTRDWDEKQLATLHYIRGLTYLACAESKLGFEEFLEALSLEASSLAFRELPAVHHQFGWQGWPNSSPLSFGKLLLEADVFHDKSCEDDPRKRKDLEAVANRIKKARSRRKNPEQSKNVFSATVG